MKKPMLLSNDAYDLEKLDYTEMYISPKHDGVRAIVTNKGLVGRSLKTFRNPHLQTYFKKTYEHLPDGVILEAEIYSECIPCREIAGICNSKNKEIPNHMILCFFGLFDKELSFLERITVIQQYYTGSHSKFDYKCIVIPQVRIFSYKLAQEYFSIVMEQGFEGAVLMDGRKKYKEGRVTIKEGIGYKMKPEREDDLVIIGVTERLENLNESKVNELGLKYKRNTVDAKKGTGIAATFMCDLGNGNTTKVTITGTEEERRHIWEHQSYYVGRTAVVKSMDYGAKDKLRHPVLVRIKERCEHE